MITQYQKSIVDLVHSIKEKYNILDTKDIDSIIKKFNITVRSCDPSSYIDYEFKIIYINSELDDTQKRFAIAESLFPFLSDSPSNIRSYDFAFELLMPHYEFIAVVHDYTTFQTNLVNISALCKHFKASQQQILTRGSRVGIF